MKNLKLRVIFIILAFLIQENAASSAVYSMIYEDYNTSSFDYCFRIFNETHQFGCQSKFRGNVGVLYSIASNNDFDKFLDNANLDSYVVVLESNLFKKSNLKKLIDSGKVEGVLVYDEDVKTAVEWSPASSCPLNRPELYSNKYGAKYQQCSGGSMNLNEDGEGMLEMSFPIPIFFVTDPKLKKRLFECIKDFNKGNSYPACAAEMKSFMSGAVSSEVCLRRNTIDAIFGGTHYCDPFGGQNVIGSLKNLDKLTNPSTILLVAPMDSRSLMLRSRSATNADTATGFITLMAVARALGSLTQAQKNSFNKNIVFGLLDGEAFDGIGGKRLVRDLANDKFPIDKKPNSDNTATITLKDIAAVIELRELGLMSDSGDLYAHYDPVSYDASTGTKIDEMLSDMNAQEPVAINLNKPTSDMALPPSTVQSVLRKKSDVPAILITEYDTAFTNKRYWSRYDTLRNLGIEYDGSETEAEMLVLITPLAQKLGNIAQKVARSLYAIANQGGSVDATVTDAIVTDNAEIGKLLYCVLFNAKCSYFDTYLSTHFSEVELAAKPLMRFVAVRTEASEHANILFNFMLAYLGVPIAQKRSKCEDDAGSRGGSSMYFMNDPINLQPNNPVCVRASVFVPAAPQADGGNVWAESSWEAYNSINLRLFLLQSQTTEIVTLVVGILVFIVAFIFIRCLNKNASVLFRSDAVL